MRMTTTVAARMENVGSPAEAIDFEGSSRDLIMTFAKWIQDNSMNSHMRVTVARNKDELQRLLTRPTANGADVDMMAELEAMLSQDTLPLPNGGEHQPDLLRAED